MDATFADRLARCGAYLHRLAQAEGWRTLGPDDLPGLAATALRWASQDEGGGRAREPDEKKARVVFLLDAPRSAPPSPEARDGAVRAHLVRLAEEDGWCKLGPSALDEVARSVLRDGDEHGFGALPSPRAVLAADRNLATLYYWHFEPAPSALGRGVVSLERFCRWATFKQVQGDLALSSRLGGRAHDVADRVFDLAYDHLMRNTRRVAFKLDFCSRSLETAGAGGRIDWDRIEVPWEFDGAMDPKTGLGFHPADHLTRHHLHYRIRQRWLRQALQEALAKLPLDGDDRAALEARIDEQIAPRATAPDASVDRREQERAEVAGRLWYLLDWGDRTARPAEAVTWRQLAFAQWGEPLPASAEAAQPRQNEPRHIECDTGARFRYGRGLGRALWRAEQEGLPLPARLEYGEDPRPAAITGLARITADLSVAVSQVEAPGKERYALRRVLEHRPEADRPAMHLISIANATFEAVDPVTGRALVVQQVEGDSGSERQRRLLDLALEAGRNAGVLLRGRSIQPAAVAGAGLAAGPAVPAAASPPPCGHDRERELWLAASRGIVPAHAQLDEMLACFQLCPGCRAWWQAETASGVDEADLDAEEDVEEAGFVRQRWLDLEDET
jgi:hypothetical protein